MRFEFVFPLLAETPNASLSFGALLALIAFILASMWIGWLANKATREGSFMQGFFLGNRGLGAWALALTATVQSGGTFMGFPSLVYTHGWSVALWIAGYMVVPITGFGFLGKRLAQLSRRTRAITVPDMFRARFNSPVLGLLASLFIMFYMTFMMVAQFKAGAIVMKLAWPTSGSLAMSEETSFELNDTSLTSLTKKLPAPVMSKLSGMKDKSFETEKKFTEELATVLTPEELKASKPAIINAITPLDKLYLMGLAIFTLTVLGYTLLGGFLAAVWTDLFQSVMMFFGVLLLLGLVLYHATHDQAIGSLQNATLVAVDNLEKTVQKSASPKSTDLAQSASENPEPAKSADATDSKSVATSSVANDNRSEARKQAEAFAFCPGFDPKGEGRAFMPLGLAFSFFFVWVFAGTGSPAGMVRLMASDSTGTIRKSIYLLSLYNACIYIPLIIVCICGRAMFPALAKTDEIVPRMALFVTKDISYVGSFLGGLILAAPFGAVMATVSSYLVVLSSGLVRDIYQRFLNPQASQFQLRRLSYISMIFVGAVAVLPNIWPIDKLQALVVFSGTGAGATFCVPAFMMAYWRRVTVAGMAASMISGASIMLGLYIAGFMGVGDGLVGQVTSFRPFYLLNIDPLIWGMLGSLIAGVGVSLLTEAPDPKLVSALFDADSPQIGKAQPATSAS